MRYIGNINSKHILVEENLIIINEKPLYTRRTTVWFGLFLFKSTVDEAVTTNNFCYRQMINAP